MEIFLCCDIILDKVGDGVAGALCGSKKYYFFTFYTRPIFLA